MANRAEFVAEGSPARCVASAKRAETPHRGIPKGAALGAPLVTFPASGKSPGCRAWQSHALAERLQVGAGTTSPAKAPGAPSMARPCSRGAPALGSAEGAQPPRIVKQELRGGAPAQSSPFVWDIQKRGQIFSIFHKNILPERVAFMQYKGNSKNAGNGAVFEL